MPPRLHTFKHSTFTNHIDRIHCTKRVLLARLAPWPSVLPAMADDPASNDVLAQQIRGLTRKLAKELPENEEDLTDEQKDALMLRHELAIHLAILRMPEEVSYVSLALRMIQLLTSLVPFSCPHRSRHYCMASSSSIKPSRRRSRR